MNAFGVAVLVGLVPVMLIVGALFLSPLLSYYAGYTLEASFLSFFPLLLIYRANLLSLVEVPMGSRSEKPSLDFTLTKTNNTQLISIKSLDSVIDWAVITKKINSG